MVIRSARQETSAHKSQRFPVLQRAINRLNGAAQLIISPESWEGESKPVMVKDIQTSGQGPHQLESYIAASLATFRPSTESFRESRGQGDIDGSCVTSDFDRVSSVHQTGSVAVY
jgi:hypothetical protein